MRRPRRDPEARLHDPRGVPTEAEERELALRARAGDRAARDELVVRNVPLVKAMAARFPATADDDLIQAGIWGLVEAADRFDPGAGVRFSSYAGYWIRRGFRDASRARHLIPVKAWLTNAASCRRETDAGREHVEALRERARRVRSVPHLHERVARELEGREPPPEEVVERAELAALVLAEFASLPDRLREIVAYAAGLDVPEGETLRTLARRHGKTKYQVILACRTTLDAMRRRLKAAGVA